MTRAGEIFALVTGGAFLGLDQDFGEDDEAELMGLRRSGRRVPVKGLSEEPATSSISPCGSP